MRWERVHVNARARETPDGRKTSGRTGGIWGPGVRWGHTCNAVKGGRLVYVFGGYGAENCQTNEVHVFDTVKQTWCKPMMKGLPPSPRDSHSCTTVGNRLFVFGGTDGKTPLKDLHILDTSSHTWIIPALHGEGPDAREGHSAAVIGKRLFIFGGCGKSAENQEVYYDDLYILDTEKLIWERAVTSGSPPSARDSHTSSSWQNKIIVLGGEDSSDCYLSDVHMLDTDTLVWKEVCTSGQMLAPRAGHTTVVIGNDLFVFGGFTDDRILYDDLHVLNIDSGLWSRVTTVDQGPSARFSVAGDCLDERKGIIVFIGGCNKDLEALDDMYYLHTDTKIPHFRSSGGVTFDAQIVNASQHGYAIKTIIDGKLHHGMVFSGTSSFVQDNRAYPNKKRVATDTFGDELKKTKPLLKAHTSTLQKVECSNQGQIDGALEKESVCQQSYYASVPNMINSTPDAGVHQQNQISRNSEPSPASLGELVTNEKIDGPQKSSMEKPCEPNFTSTEVMQVLPEPNVLLRAAEHLKNLRSWGMELTL